MQRQKLIVWVKNNPQCLLWLIKVFVINTAIQLLINVKHIISWFKAFLGFDFFRKFMLVWFFFDTDIHNMKWGEKTYSGWLYTLKKFQIKEKQQTLMYIWQSVKYLALLNSAQFLVHNNHTQTNFHNFDREKISPRPC